MNSFFLFNILRTDGLMVVGWQGFAEALKIGKPLGALLNDLPHDFDVHADAKLLPASRPSKILSSVNTRHSDTPHVRVPLREKACGP